MFDPKSNQTRRLVMALKIAAGNKLPLAAAAMIAISLACAIPGMDRLGPSPTVESTPAPEVTVGPQPPDIVETDPVLGAEVPLAGPLTLYFNQPMDALSVEAALSGEPPLAGSFEWLDDSTLSFTPENPWLPETDLTIRLEATAKAANGLTLGEPLALDFKSVGYLRLAHSLPAQNAEDVDPSSAVVASFNRPVMPLGADGADFPAAFSIEPMVEGQGEWINTSTYIFYPEPPLPGGVTYEVSLEPGLRATNDAPLEEAVTWSFSTALPRLLSVEPEPGGEAMDLDGEVVLTFNQGMDTASVEANFTLLGPDGEAIQGEGSWDEANRVFTFTPDDLLARQTRYRIELSGEAQARGGSLLGEDFQALVSTVAELAVADTYPASGRVKEVYEGVTVTFSSPLGEVDPVDYIGIEPEVDLDYSLDERSLHLFGFWDAETDYTLTISEDVTDRWGDSLGEDYVLTFSTAALEPSLYVGTYLNEGVLFTSPSEPAVSVQAVNIPAVDMAVGSIELADFIRLNGPGGYDAIGNYRAPDLRTWRQPIEIARNRAQPANLPMRTGGGGVSPGIYWVSVEPAESLGLSYYGEPFFVVASHVNLTFKISATDVLVWAVDRRENVPVAGEAVSVWDGDGRLLVSGVTDEEGVLRATIAARKDGYGNAYAVMGASGEEYFSLALSTWDRGIAAWDFGYRSDFSAPHTETYFYTERPIYRPGQTVYFRGIVREAYNGRYSMVDLSALPVRVYDDLGSELASYELPLSEYGTVEGSFTVPEAATPGLYRIASGLDDDFEGVSFQVAEYRKPEIDLQVDFLDEEIQLDEVLEAEVEARYFFDAPAGNAELQWHLSATEASFYLPGYSVGPLDTRWLRSAFLYGFGFFGTFISDGEGKTDAAGGMALELPVELSTGTQEYTLEVTIEDESGFPVSARTSAIVHPAPIYLGVRPDDWMGRADEEMGFEVQIVDWEKKAVGPYTLTARFSEVVWVREVDRITGFSSYTREYTEIASTEVTSDAQGSARLVFTPPGAGTYMLEVTSSGALTEVLIWVGGPGQVQWPSLPDNRLRLTADKESYQPGDSAQVFVPNPFGEGSQALVSIERAEIFDYQVLNLDEAGVELSIPLTAQEAPNVYVSVVLLGYGESGGLDFRQGCVNLAVAPAQQTLNVQVVGEPQYNAPGDEVTFAIEVTDSAGDPVEGEFSLAVVDLAVLALADPFAPDILSAYYGEQPLGVRTGMPLTAAAENELQDLGGMGGGGGGEEAPPLREEFEDTAYWGAQIVTDEDGLAQVTATLPDNLTTWQVDVRGVTEDTRVGEAETQVITTKELLIRPVAPRFLVMGDRVQIAAVVHNNSEDALPVEVAIQANGILLDDPAQAIQQVDVPAGGRARLEWWGLVQDVEVVELIFAAEGGELQDLTRPTQGNIPVLHYTAPQTFATAGTMTAGGQMLELVSLPRSYDPTGGELTVELAPSLAAGMLDALEVLEHYPYECTEQTLSRFLPNLELYRAVREFGIDAPQLEASLARTLDAGMKKLLNEQNFDGGWGWWTGQRSNPLVSAYVVFGLHRAMEAGEEMPEWQLTWAIDFLEQSLTDMMSSTDGWELDRMAFISYVLAQVGVPPTPEVEYLYLERERLNPWGQALLALTLEEISAGDPRVDTLLSNLQGTAVRSATGASWEELSQGWQNMSSNTLNSAVVVYGLAQLDPASPLLSDAVRHLMALREAGGAWNSTYATAWTLMALTEVLRGTGELGGAFDFEASLNGNVLLSGQAGGTNQLTPISSTVGLDDLHPELPNTLSIQRDSGVGRLYYTAYLKVNRPVEEVPPLARGINVSRAYFDAGEVVENVPAGEQFTARLTLTLPDDAYYVVVEDYIPAGTELLNTSLKTTQLLGFEEDYQPDYDPADPFAEGWGWWYFNAPQIFDERIAWAADFLPAGTYELTYTLVALQPGEYRVLPASAWQFYFPEVQGNSAGAVFEVLP